MDRAESDQSEQCRWDDTKLKLMADDETMKEVIVNEASEPVKCADLPEGEQCGSKKGQPVQGCVPSRSTVAMQNGDKHEQGGRR